MNKHVVVTIAVVAMIAGVVFGYLRALPDDFIENTTETGFSDYGYRCGDGSEFTLVPNAHMESVRIVPATSVDYVRETELKSLTDSMGMYYEGDGILLRPTASGLLLVSAGHATTTCSSMRPADESLFNLGA